MIADLLPSLLRRRALAIMGGLGIAFAGLWAMSRLKLEAYPDLSETQVTVVTLFPGHAAEEVEQQVTVPVERALQSVPKVVSRRSRTIFGLSVVDLTFEYNVDDYFARQVALEKLREAELPAGAEPSLAPPTTPAGELYRYTVDAEGADLMQLRELQDWVISPRFLQVAGVGDAFAFGGLVKQYQIEVDPQALRRYGLTINRIAEAVSANNQNAGGSLLTHGQQAMVVRGVGAVRSVSDIENIVIASAKGVPAFVRDVGKVRIGPAPRNGIFGLGARSDCVEGIVVMRRGENPSEVLAGVREAVNELNASGLPAGVRINPIYDRTELVQNTVRTVSRTLTEGLGLVFFVLLFFLGSFEAAVLTALAVPFSLLFACCVMYLFGVSASLLSLGAIDFGIIVDGTLVVVEYVVRRVRHSTGVSALEVVKDAAVRIQRPVFFSLMILVAAYLPLFTLERVERRLFTPMAQTVCAALAGSLLFALLLVPVLSTWLFRHGARGWRNPLMHWLARRYESVVGLALGRPALTTAATAAIVAACFSLSGRLGTEFLPQLDEGVIWIRSNLTPGISLEKSVEVAARVRAAVAQVPEVALVTSQTGRQESNTEPFGPNRSEFLVALRPYSTWAHGGKTKATVTQDIANRLRSAFPGATFNFTQPIIDMVTEAVTGSSADLAIILSGPDFAVLRAKSAEALEMLRRVPGAADTAIEQDEGQAQVRLHVNRQETARYGINVKDVQDVIELAIGGRPVSAVYEGDRVFDIVVRYIPEARSTVGNIGNILVPAEGGSVPLRVLAAIDVDDGATIVSRRESRRQMAVRTNIRGRDQGSFVAEAQKLFAGKVSLPPGYRVEWGGQFENLARARARLVWILPVTVAIIFALLYWAFGSVLDAALVLVNVPFSIAGGVVALYLREVHFSVSAAVGFVSLFGISVMTGVLYLTEINRQLREEHAEPRLAVLRGACTQFRPGLMLITLALLGIMPAAFATGIGSDVQRPLATVILGGLTSTLLLGLLSFPGLCYLAKRSRASKARIAEA